jgi:hypothetical protein
VFGAGFTALLSSTLHLSYVNLLAWLLLVPGGQSKQSERRRFPSSPFPTKFLAWKRCVQCKEVNGTTLEKSEMLEQLRPLISLCRFGHQRCCVLETRKAASCDGDAAVVIAIAKNVWSAAELQEV